MSCSTQALLGTSLNAAFSAEVLEVTAIVANRSWKSP